MPAESINTKVAMVQPVSGTDRPGYSGTEVDAGSRALPAGTIVPAELRSLFARPGAFSDDVNADPQCWGAFHLDLTDPYGYLSCGWLAQDPAASDPVQRVRPEATVAEGVDRTEINLSLSHGAFAFARLRDVPCFYVCVPSHGMGVNRYYEVNVESGQDAGIYEIWVSPAHDLDSMSVLLRRRR